MNKAAETVSGSKLKKSKYDKWELEDAVRTLERAEEIKMDKALMKALGPFIKDKKKAIMSLDQLRKIAVQKISEERA